MSKSSFDSRVFYWSVLALVLPMAAQNLINVGISSLDVIDRKSVV